MSMNEQPNTREGRAFGGRCVLLAASAAPEQLRRCRASIREHTSGDVAVVEVEHSASAVNREIKRLAPADVILFTEACEVSAHWLERLTAAANADTNTASASAFADAGTPLALRDRCAARGNGSERHTAVPLGHSRALRPRISRAVAPCVYLRRDALQLAGPLDEVLDLCSAVEIDFAQRCVLDGLGHVAADDVVVERLDASDSAFSAETAAALRERYPYLDATPVADSGVLAEALLRARAPWPRLPVTFDARALDGAITGTQVHVLELILALARTEALQLRVLVRDEQIDAATRRLLDGLPHTELLAAERLDPHTARSVVFHRPQQTFSPSDVGLGLALGERFVISQLDLIAYRNPGYFVDAATWQDYRAANRHGLSAAERVVVFSTHTRDELLADALVDAARVTVVPPGVDHRRADARRPAALGVDWPAGFLLCLGTDFRHKNRLFALRLLAALRRQHGWSGGLVLAGAHVSPGSSAQDEREYMLEHPDLDEFVVSLGTIDEREREWLVANAGAIAYPSAYEGFGLVPFESALSGVPCLFASQSSLADVAPAGTATIVPWDAVASAASAHVLLTNAEARDTHVHALAAAARELTWDRAAAATVEIYREAALAPVRDSATLSRDLVAREARLSVQHEEEVASLVDMREHARQMYDALNAEVGFGLILIGPNGALPENVQRALLALVARPSLSRPLFRCLSGVFLGVRAFLRPIKALSRRSR
jgi:glycosyltransferase involved in cell wall biosynthesis